MIFLGNRPHRQKHTHTLPWSLSHTPNLSFACISSRSLSLSLSLINMHKHKHTNTHTLSHTYAHASSRTHTHTHAHTHTHTHAHTYTHAQVPMKRSSNSLCIRLYSAKALRCTTLPASATAGRYRCWWRPRLTSTHAMWCVCVGEGVGGWVRVGVGYVMNKCVYVCERVCVFVCLCLCMLERETERERERKYMYTRTPIYTYMHTYIHTYS